MYHGRMSTGQGARHDDEERRPNGPRRWIRRLAVLAVLYLVVCGFAMLFEKWLIFFPSRFPEGDWDVPSRIGLQVDEVTFVASDGVRLHAWIAETSPTAPFVVFFHGNAGNITHRADLAKSLVDCGLSVLLVDYRGYGKSEGKPSEPGLYLDGEAVWSYLVKDQQVDPGRIIFFGRSLGGGVAAEMAVRHPGAGGVILESTFRSIVAIGKKQYPFLPVSLLLRTRFDNLSKMPNIKISTLVIHGREDHLIPFAESEALYSALSSGTPSEFFAVEHAHHNDTWLVGGRHYAERIKEFAFSAIEESD